MKIVLSDFKFTRTFSINSLSFYLPGDSTDVEILTRSLQIDSENLAAWSKSYVRSFSCKKNTISVPNEKYIRKDIF